MVVKNMSAAFEALLAGVRKPLEETLRPLAGGQATLREYEQLSLVHAGDARVPLLLPIGRAGVVAVYVICHGRDGANRLRDTLRAAAAHHYAPFSGRTHQLSQSDPVERAILEYAGVGSTYLLVPEPHTLKSLWAALLTMTDLLAARPIAKRDRPRSPGELLREFELALATGLADESAALLDAMKSTGGISLENQQYLAIRRLFSIGRYSDLLGSPGLSAVVQSEPPRAVAELILRAWVAEANARIGVESNVASTIDDLVLLLRGHRGGLPALVEPGWVPHDPDARLAVALVVLARDDTGSARVILASDRVGIPLALVEKLQILTMGSEHPEVEPAPVEEVDPQPKGQAPDPVDTVGENVGDSKAHAPSSASTVDTRPSPASWVDWARRGLTEASLPDADPSRWSALHFSDADLAAVLAEMGEEHQAVSAALAAVVIDEDEVSKPAWQTAQVLAEYMCISSLYSISEVSAIHALFQIFLRHTPDRRGYVGMLETIETDARWASVQFADQVVDFADSTAVAPCADVEARLRFVTTLFTALMGAKQRLPGSTLSLIRQIDREIGLQWDWSVPDKPADLVQHQFGPSTVLLYSLDDAVVKRVADQLQEIAPEVTVRTSSAKVGSPELRQYARASDILVVATRRAAHAATGFLEQNRAENSVVVYPEGGGSASMLRAAVNGLTQRDD